MGGGSGRMVPITTLSILPLPVEKLSPTNMISVGTSPGLGLSLKFVSPSNDAELPFWKLSVTSKVGGSSLKYPSMIISCTTLETTALVKASVNSNPAGSARKVAAGSRNHNSPTPLSLLLSRIHIVMKVWLLSRMFRDRASSSRPRRAGSSRAKSKRNCHFGPTENPWTVSCPRVPPSPSVTRDRRPLMGALLGLRYALAAPSTWVHPSGAVVVPPQSGPDSKSPLTMTFGPTMPDAGAAHRAPAANVARPTIRMEVFMSAFCMA